MMENDRLSRIEALYDGYLQTAAELEKNRQFGDGLLGLRPGPADDPCHLRFAGELEALLQEAAASADSGEAAAILQHLYTAPKRTRDIPLSAYWMLIAVQGQGRELIGLLSPEDAAALLVLFNKRYPRRMRLPIQDQILKQLKLQAEKQQ
jgi:hypothetical protein